MRGQLQDLFERSDYAEAVSRKVLHSGTRCLNRRNLTVGALACTCGAASAPSPNADLRLACSNLDGAANIVFRAASEHAKDQSNPSLEAYSTSGDPRFDKVLGVRLSDLAARFEVRPAFFYYDDSLSANAQAFDRSVLPGTRGVVLLGRTLLKSGLQSDPHGDLFILSVCAHEFGHIVQYFSGFHRRLTYRQTSTKLLELHADFLAGYFIATRGATYNPDDLVALGRAWERIGDVQFTSPQHHGTPEERLKAIETAFAIGRNRPEFNVREIAEIGAKYLGA